MPLRSRIAFPQQQNRAVADGARPARLRKPLQPDGTARHMQTPWRRGRVFRIEPNRSTVNEGPTAAHDAAGVTQGRPEERLVGTECGSTCSTRWSTYYSQN